MKPPNKSIWQETKSKRLNSLTQNQSTEICIIGSGISGLTIAYELLKLGKSVIILDKEKKLCRETTLTSAHISCALDNLYSNLNKIIGQENSKLAAESHTLAIKKIEDIINKENIDCDFLRVPGYLFASDQKSVDTILKELKATHESGLKDTSIIKILPDLAIKIGPALLFPNQAQFHPLKYLKGLFKAVLNLGGTIYGRALVIDYKNEEDKISVKTETGYVISCQYLVFATNVPSHHRVSMHTKESAYRSYVIGVKIPKKYFPKVLLWDTAEPYHYVRVQEGPDFDILIVGGEDHRVGQGENSVDYFEKLEHWTKRTLGVSGNILYKWSGQIIETLDGLAYIGRSPPHKGKNIFEVSGDSGHGLTHGTIAGIIIPSLITGQDNPWTELYDPSRKTYNGNVATYLIENLKSAVQALDWITPGEVEDELDIPPGSGAILRRGFKKVAVYRDEYGKLHQCSAVCPHMGAVVHWNESEKTWDCPMHGSRFCSKGKVINGPVNTNLTPVNSSEKKKK